MTCPKCAIALVPTAVDGLELDTCPGCGGLWFDAGELRKAKDLADENLNWMDFELWEHEDRFQIRPGLACPRCSTTMGSLEYASTGVQVETCPECRGAWLDAGDLERIVHALQDELAGKPAKELFAETFREARELITGPESFLSEWRDLRQIVRLLRLRLTIEKPLLRDRVEKTVRANPQD